MKAGDVTYLNILGRPIVVLNSVQAAIDLLDKRSSNYSDRGDFPLCELMGHSKTLVFMKYGQGFQLQRKMYQQYFSKNMCISYRPMQSREARILVHNIISQPEKWEEQLVQ